ncbi:hypothetical protein FQN54_002224 [Arachnomyces sp. PD_36]|nr:hypothetical protein FQN54_002224 [Arachnomyces sp. PD_36]
MDASASTAHGANVKAIQKIQSVIEGSNIPRTHKNAIKYAITKIDPNVDLHRTSASPHGPVVEVQSKFTWRTHTGHVHSLRTVLDVDIPPSHSSQAPHFGYEVHLDGTRLGIGHVWLPKNVLQSGRPAPGTRLETYSWTTSPWTHAPFQLPDGMHVSVSFRRYR